MGTGNPANHCSMEVCCSRSAACKKGLSTSSKAFLGRHPFVKANVLRRHGKSFRRHTQHLRGQIRLLGEIIDAYAKVEANVVATRSSARRCTLATLACRL